MTGTKWRQPLYSPTTEPAKKKAKRRASGDGFDSEHLQAGKARQESGLRTTPGYLKKKNTKKIVSEERGGRGEEEENEGEEDGDGGSSYSLHLFSTHFIAIDAGQGCCPCQEASSADQVPRHQRELQVEEEVSAGRWKKNLV